jgi:hypothetical protein
MQILDLGGKGFEVTTILQCPIKRLKLLEADLNPLSGKSYLRGRLSAVDLLLLTSLDQLLLILKILFTFFY